MTESSVGKADSARMQKPAKVKKGTMRIVPLGGLGEVGRNMTVFELNGKLLIVDCGVLFIKANTNIVVEGEIAQVGNFECEFVAVNHSIPDALAVFLRTEAGTVLHTGDFKMDQLPLDGRITDLRHFARLGEEGVDLFLPDSTNAEVPGFTVAEREIGPVLEAKFARARRRIIVASFSSHVHRVQQVLDAAAMHGRKVAFIGRSMVRNMGIAERLGYLLWSGSWSI